MNIKLILSLVLSTTMLVGCSGEGNTESQTKSKMETAPKIELNDFFKNPEKTSYQISPDGKYYSYLAPYESRKNIHVENKVSSLFFSRHNIDTLQSAIRYSVYKRSQNKHIIDNQSENDLMVVMRSIYLQYSKNLPYDIIEQVKRLNSMVLDYCVPNILREVNQYHNYTNDISSLPIPLEHAKNMSSKGTKINHMKEF